MPIEVVHPIDLLDRAYGGAQGLADALKGDVKPAE